MAAPAYPVTREAIVAALAGLEREPRVLAAWLGGSDATGRTDAWSDVDLQLAVEDGDVEAGLAAARAVLATVAPLARTWRLPEPTWHGHAQELLAVEGAAPWTFVDLVVLQRSATERFLERERHGEPVVLFDRVGFVVAPPLDRAALAARRRARLATLRTTFPLLQGLVTKAVRRGHAPYAAQALVSHALAPLAELLRMRHAPDVFDYGLRYLDRDLPADLADELARLALPGSLEAVEAARARCEALFAANLAELDAGIWAA